MVKLDFESLVQRTKQLLTGAIEQANTEYSDWLDGQLSYQDFALADPSDPSSDLLPLAPFREAFDVLVASATQESQLNPAGEFTFELLATNFLRNRLGVLAWARQNPQLLASPVDQPIFITGHGRTGTTLLSYLLDRDPATRSLLNWEAANPVPPPAAAELYDNPRIAAAVATAQLADEARPELKTIHREAPDGPTECVSLLAHAGRSMLFETQWNLPSYGEWYLDRARDQLDAYAYHRVALQVLASRAPGRWMLKSPHHSVATADILATYPDARFIITHRDPAVSFASVLNLITTFTRWSSDADWSEYICARWQHVWLEIIERMEETRRGGGGYGDRFFDVLYADLMDDPMGAVAEIYEWLGWELTAEARDAMSEWMNDNPQGKHGRHSYSLGDFGYSYDEADALFGDYMAQYRIPKENR